MSLRSLLILALMALHCKPATEAEPQPAEKPVAQPYDLADSVAMPHLFAPGIVSSPQEEYRITFAPDRRTAYFARSEAFFPFARQATIYVSTYENGQWGEPVVAPFSGQYSDIDPSISPDGNRLYFSSIRPVNGEERADADLWVVERTGEGWSEPIHLGEAVNSGKDELYPSVDAEGTLYFGSDRSEDWNIYQAKLSDEGGYSEAQSLSSAINTEDVWEFNPTISADGQTLVFTSLNRPGGLGFGDLYVSQRQDETWQPARNLGAPVNTGADEFHASWSPEGTYLFFIRRPLVEEAQGDVYQVRWEEE